MLAGLKKIYTFALQFSELDNLIINKYNLL